MKSSKLAEKLMKKDKVLEIKLNGLLFSHYLPVSCNLKNNFKYGLKDEQRV
jgi:hypothetical protein